MVDNDNKMGAEIRKGLGRIMSQVKVEGTIKIFDKDGKLKSELDIVSNTEPQEPENNGN